MSQVFKLGAVAYDPKVVTIWEGFKSWFAKNDFAFDFVLYSNYESQVEAHLAGHFDVAWNSPLAWLQLDHVAKRIGRTASAFAMRDTDCDLTSVVVVRDDSPIKSLADLKGKKVAFGAKDSPQATLLPLWHLHEAGLDVQKDIESVHFDVLVGKHGDHIGGERDGAKALMKNEVDAACVIAGNHLLFTQEGTFLPGQTRVLSETKPFDHCNFSVLEDVPAETVARFRELLLSMSFDDPEVRPLLEMEGLREWKPGRVEGYTDLESAMNTFGYSKTFLDSLAARYS